LRDASGAVFSAAVKRQNDRKGYRALVFTRQIDLKPISSPVEYDGAVEEACLLRLGPGSCEGSDEGEDNG
jgi:hypothetical protein